VSPPPPWFERPAALRRQIYSATVHDGKPSGAIRTGDHRPSSKPEMKGVILPGAGMETPPD
jgi:hypothetical protein